MSTSAINKKFKSLTSMSHLRLYNCILILSTRIINCNIQGRSIISLIANGRVISSPIGSTTSTSSIHPCSSSSCLTSTSVTIILLKPLIILSFRGLVPMQLQYDVATLDKYSCNVPTCYIQSIGH